VSEGAQGEGRMVREKTGRMGSGVDCEGWKSVQMLVCLEARREMVYLLERTRGRGQDGMQTE